MTRVMPGSLALASFVLVIGCGRPQVDESKAAPTTSATSTASVASTPSAASGANDPGALHLGAPIEGAVPAVSLADLAKNPGAWSGKSFTTEGTVSAVCQQMGCWMEIRDDASQAHIKMAGHKFFVPKTSAGHHAKVLASIATSDAPACSDEADCHASQGSTSAAANPLAKVELVADGVELM